ncbi:MAG TPA: hypothetical protein VF590_19460, partial [Isosphaeraceae bacterium]
QRDSLFEKQRLSAMSALTRALAEIGIGNEAERRIALRRLDALAADTGSYPEITSFLAEYAAILDRVRHGASSPEELNRVQLAALDAGHRLRDRVLRSATPELVAVLADERKLAFEIVQFCAAQTVATFAERPYREADPYVREFWILYWGEMAQVEGRRVESAMVRFGRTLQEIDENVRRHAPAGLNAQAPAPRVRAHNARQAFQQFAYEGSDEPWTRRAEEYIRDATVDPADVRRLRDDLANLTQALDAERHQDLTLLRTPAAQP